MSYTKYTGFSSVQQCNEHCNEEVEGVKRAQKGEREGKPKGERWDASDRVPFLNH